MKKMKKKYTGNLTSGSLLINQSIVVAGLLLNGFNEKETRDKIIEDNLFQVSSEATTKKYLSLIFLRYKHLPTDMLNFINSGDELLCRMTLFYCVLKTNTLIYEFFNEVIIDKVMLNDCQLKILDWELFIENKILTESEIAGWSKITQVNIRQVAIRIMKEAGFLENVKNPQILFPLLPYELEEELIKKSEHNIISILKLER